MSASSRPAAAPMAASPHSKPSEPVRTTSTCGAAGAATRAATTPRAASRVSGGRRSCLAVVPASDPYTAGPSKWADAAGAVIAAAQMTAAVAIEVLVRSIRSSFLEAVVVRVRKYERGAVAASGDVPYVGRRGSRPLPAGTHERRWRP